MCSSPCKVMHWRFWCFLRRKKEIESSYTGFFLSLLFLWWRTIHQNNVFQFFWMLGVFGNIHWCWFVYQPPVASVWIVHADQWQHTFQNCLLELRGANYKEAKCFTSCTALLTASESSSSSEMLETQSHYSETPHSLGNSTILLS